MTPLCAPKGKTLKQQLQAIQEETEEIYWNEKSIIYAVKEWLTQKPSETGQQITLRIDSMSPNQRKKYAKAANEHYISKDGLLSELGL